MSETSGSSDDEITDFCEFISDDFSNTWFEEEIILKKKIYVDSLEVMLDNIIQNEKYLNDISYNKIDIIFKNEPILYSTEFEEDGTRYIVFDDFVHHCLLKILGRKTPKMLYILHKMMRLFKLDIISNTKIKWQSLYMKFVDVCYFGLDCHETNINVYANDFLQFFNLILCFDKNFRYSYIYSTIKLIIENEIERKIPLSQIIFQQLMQF